MHTHNYIKKCKKQRIPNGPKQTFDYLRKKNLKAVPFDKGQGFVLMSNNEYCSRINDLTSLTQFKKVKRQRKNEKHSVMKDDTKNRNE